MSGGCCGVRGARGVEQRGREGHRDDRFEDSGLKCKVGKNGEKTEGEPAETLRNGEARGFMGNPKCG